MPGLDRSSCIYAICGIYGIHSIHQYSTSFIGAREEEINERVLFPSRHLFLGNRSLKKKCGRSTSRAIALNKLHLRYSPISFSILYISCTNVLQASYKMARLLSLYVCTYVCICTGATYLYLSNLNFDYSAEFDTRASRIQYVNKIEYSMTRY